MQSTQCPCVKPTQCPCVDRTQCSFGAHTVSLCGTHTVSLCGTHTVAVHDSCSCSCNFLQLPAAHTVPLCGAHTVSLCGINPETLSISHSVHVWNTHSVPVWISHIVLVKPTQCPCLGRTQWLCGRSRRARRARQLEPHWSHPRLLPRAAGDQRKTPLRVALQRNLARGPKGRCRALL